MRKFEQLPEYGGEHTIYLNPRCRLKLPVPRHREISDGVTRKLLKDASKAG